MKQITIFGATGFIGTALTQHLMDKKYTVTAVTRNKNKAQKSLDERVTIFQWDYKNISKLSELLDQTDVIINLAGANIASKLWTRKQKQKILNSRINAGQKITQAIEKTKQKPQLFIQGSAIGYYGYDTKERCTEKAPKGDGFLAYVTDEWEKSTLKVELYGVRRAIIRTGMVLGKSGGIFPKLTKPLKYFVGANFGNGEQGFSWIHLSDEIRAIEFIVKNHQLSGIFNLTAPQPVKSKTFNKIVAKALNRPVWLIIPKFICALIPGNMGKEVFLANQWVIPSQLQESGFTFSYVNLTEAVNQLIKS
ncbi:MAG TPA: TIGR01777 family oxidoreductase [Bacteroidales bacterium]|nr:TIGR01777 family oxidoreductase [Bacteroidales bacterium]